MKSNERRGRRNVEKVKLYLKIYEKVWKDNSLATKTTQDIVKRIVETYIQCRRSATSLYKYTLTYYRYSCEIAKSRDAIFILQNFSPTLGPMRYSILHASYNVVCVCIYVCMCVWFLYIILLTHTHMFHTYVCINYLMRLYMYL